MNFAPGEHVHLFHTVAEGTDMTTKQGQPNAGGSRKQEGEGNQSHQEKTKRDLQQDQAGQGASQPGGSQKKGPLPGSQKDKRGKIGQ